MTTRQPQTRRMWTRISEPQREDKGWSPLLLLPGQSGHSRGRLCPFLPSRRPLSLLQGSGDSASHPFALCASVSPLALGELLPGSGVTFSVPIGSGPLVVLVLEHGAVCEGWLQAPGPNAAPFRLQTGEALQGQK